MGLLIYSIIVSVVLFAGIIVVLNVFFYFKKTRKFEKTVSAIANTYISISYVDIPTNYFEEIQSEPFVTALIGKKGNAQEALNKTVVEGFVTDTYINRMKEFTDLSTLQERLIGKTIISQEYEGVSKGWCRVSFIPSEYDEDGKVKSVLYTVRQIQGEILSLRGQLNVEETLLECVLTLSKNTDADTSINQLLANIGSYHHADRAYIFEINNTTKTASNTYEWCHKDVTPEINNLQNLKIQDIQMFINLCKMEVLKLANINYFSKDSVEFKLLEAQNITSLMVVPLMKGDEMVGFIGVDNPKVNRETVSILKSVSSFVITELEKKEYINELYALSYKDMMTGVYNRHANMRDLDELIRNSNNKNIGIVYCDVNGLKTTNDNFGHEKGDQLIIKSVNMLKKYYSREGDRIYRTGGDEFVVICQSIDEETFNRKYNELIGELTTNVILSTGKSWLADCNNITALLKVAENNMYETKKAYYQTHERRAR